MASLLHVTGQGHEPLPPFSGHLVRNLEWDRYSPDAVDAAVDVVVASPSSPGDAVRLVVDLRESGRGQDVYLISDGAPGWASVGLAFEAVQVVDGVEALGRALAGEDAHEGGASQDRAPSEPPGAADLDEQRLHVPRGGTRGMLRERLGDGAAGLSRTMRDFDRRLEEDGLRDGSPATSTPDGLSPNADDDVALSPPVRPYPDDAPWPAPAPELRPPDASSAAPDPGSEPATRRGRRETADPDVLVRSLLAVADRLYGVRETGTAVAGHVKDLVGVDAVAVLVPDGSVWAVAGAVGTRHLEDRLTLAADHWLVHEVSEVQHGVIVEDTDIVRTRLAGAPLAAWRHLMACPLADVRGIVVLARSDNGPAFTSRDLAHASRALHDAGPLFASAVGVRELARRLRTLAELDDPGSGHIDRAVGQVIL